MNTEEIKKNLSLLVELLNENNRKIPDIYCNDILNWMFQHGIGIFKDGKLILVNPLNNDLSRSCEDEFIKEKLKTYEFTSNCISAKNEKYSFFNNLFGIFYDEFNKLVSENPVQYLIGFLCNLEYNRFLALRLVQWSKNLNTANTVIDCNDGGDEFLKLLFETLNFYQKSSELLKETQFSNSINVKYSSIENQLSVDKTCIEYAINLVYSIISKNKSILHRNNDSYRYEKALQISRAITKINALKIAFTEGQYKDIPIQIDNGNFKNIENNLEDDFIEYFDTLMSNVPLSNSESYLIKINDIVKNYYGFEFQHFKNIQKNLDKVKKNVNDYIIGIESDILEAIQIYAECTDIEARNIFEFIRFKVDDSTLFDETAYKKYRICKNCIVEVDGLFFCACSLLVNSFLIFENSVLYGDVDDKFKSCLNNIYEEINNDFEREVASNLRKYLPCSKVIENIPHNLSSIDLPGQIDILILFNNKIFIIECKNIGKKITLRSKNNFEQKFNTSSKKSFQAKLKSKVEFIEDNKDIFLSNIDCIGNYDEVIGVFAISGYNSIITKNDNFFPAIVWTQLAEWIKKKSNNK